MTIEYKDGHGLFWVSGERSDTEPGNFVRHYAFTDRNTGLVSMPSNPDVACQSFKNTYAETRRQAGKDIHDIWLGRVDDRTFSPFRPDVEPAELPHYDAYLDRVVVDLLRSTQDIVKIQKGKEGISKSYNRDHLTPEDIKEIGNFMRDSLGIHCLNMNEGTEVDFVPSNHDLPVLLGDKFEKAQAKRNER